MLAWLQWFWHSQVGKVLLAVTVIVVGVCALRLSAPDLLDRDRASQATFPPVAPGTAAPLDVADAFAHAWLTPAPADEWYARLLPHATSALAGELAATDPVTLPVARITGEAQPLAHSDSMLEVAYPAEGGTLRLRLVAPRERWLVEQVEWRSG